MNINDLNRKKTPIVRIDNTLTKYKAMPVFQDKVDKANAILLSAGIPKINGSKV